jgi:hypothetical protein
MQNFSLRNLREHPNRDTTPPRKPNTKLIAMSAVSSMAQA